MNFCSIVVDQLAHLLVVLVAHKFQPEMAAKYHTRQKSIYNSVKTYDILIK